MHEPYERDRQADRQIDHGTVIGEIAFQRWCLITIILLY